VEVKELSNARETRARRVAHRNGYTLHKSRVYGTWLVIDPEQNRIVAGEQSAPSNGTNGWLLEDVEAWLDQGVSTTRRVRSGAVPRRSRRPGHRPHFRRVLPPGFWREWLVFILICFGIAIEFVFVVFAN
jgi:hypothetical protein